MKKVFLFLLIIISIGATAQTSTMINGVGTKNRIPKFTGANKIGNSQIIDNGKIGINTLTPAATLDVNGTAKFSDTVTITTMNDADTSNRAASTAFVKRVLSTSLTGFDLQAVTTNGNQTTKDIVIRNERPFPEDERSTINFSTNAGYFPTIQMSLLKGAGAGDNRSVTLRMDSLQFNEAHNYQFPNKSGVFALVSDISGGAAYIPITGTSPSTSVGGNIEAKVLTGGTPDNFSLYQNHGTKTSRFNLLAGGGVGMQIFNSLTGNFSYLNLNEGNVKFGTSIGSSIGLSSEVDHSSSISQLDYTQKIYVDKKIDTLKKYTWGTNGNAGTNPTTNFIGTTDNQDLAFKVNNFRFGKLNYTNNNISFGENSLNSLTTGYNNIGLGKNILLNNTTGFTLVAIGMGSLENNISGSQSVAIGGGLKFNTTGSYNYAIGSSLSNNTTGSFNIGIGSSFGNITTSIGNVGIGVSVGQGVTGNYNTSLGFASLSVSGGSSSTNCTTIGASSTINANINNATAIGANAYVSNSNSLVLGSISGVNGSSSNTNVGIGTSSPDNTLHIVGGVKFDMPSKGVGKVLTSDAAGGATWKAPSKIITSADATDVNFSIVVNTGTYLPNATLSTNKTITIPTGTNGDFIEIFNNESVFTWLLAGSPVYYSDGITTVPSLVSNTNYLIRFISGKWRILN